MASTLRGVIEALRAAIRTIDGTGSYTNTLNTTDDQVLITTVWPPPQLPVVMIQDFSLSTVVEGIPLGQYRRVVRVTIMGFVGANSALPGERALAAADLLSDIAIALEADRRLGGLVYDVTITETTVVDGFEETGMEIGACGLIVEVYWETSTGV